MKVFSFWISSNGCDAWTLSNKNGTVNQFWYARSVFCWFRSIWIIMMQCDQKQNTSAKEANCCPSWADLLTSSKYLKEIELSN